MIQELKDHLETTSPIQLNKEWDEVKEFAAVGPKALDFIKDTESARKIVKEEMKDTDLI